MINNFVLIILLFNNLSLQVSSGSIEYRKVEIERVFNKNAKTAQEKRFSQIEDETIKALKKIVFVLKFNKEKSFFSVRREMNISEMGYFELAIGPDGDSKYYNSKTDIIRQVNTFGEDFLISKYKYKWILKSESKKIGKHKCYRAILVEKLKTRKGIKNIIVEAWYTPELNIPFGPIGYNGLPGLILELKKDNFIYQAININLNIKEKIIIEKPTKGKKVTQEEFYDIAISAMKDFKKNRGY
tara:strand:+ start:310 stop:1035 length:726 start_codon:yes stop_codon:yes gene_type:complete